ncbi:MAG: phage tail protein [Candidatus Accumulibacter sp.]|jgi:microcystin-dependent protein|nr:phage tail protein [Accumulibacter sp.]
MKYVQPIGAAANASYVDGNPSTGVEGSVVPAAALEHPQREILAVITAAGLTPASTNLGQLLQAIQMLSSANGAFIPVGMCATFPCTTPPTGWIERNGALLSRTAYPDLWAFAQASGNLLSADSLWVEATKGKFSPGNGTTTFRIPDHRGEFLRMWDSSAGVDVGRAIGSFQGDAIRNITGMAPPIHGGYYNLVSGAFYVDSGITSPTIFGETNGITRIQFDASRVVPTAAENRPRSVAVLACIKY